MQNQEARTDLQIPAKGGSNFAPDERTEQLLRVFSELEPQEARMSPEEFSELLQHAAVACGFADAAEACVSLIGPALFELQRKSGLRCSGKGGTRTTIRSLVTS
jgi:hypothetical protein